METSYTSYDTAHSAKQPLIGVLLVHGLNGSRRDFAELEVVLQDRGMLTHNMLLPGHGGNVRDMLSLGWHDWAGDCTMLASWDIRYRSLCDSSFWHLAHSVSSVVHYSISRPPFWIRICPGPQRMR